jgi:two-component system, chemotaxis family, response regulator WspF
MKIAIVNDSMMAVAVLRGIILDAKYQLAWIAVNGAEAVELAIKDRPDLILMDLVMPTMNGIEATRQIMAQAPCPILVVTASVEGNSGQVFEALGAGALDAVSTPVLNSDAALDERDTLLSKINILKRLAYSEKDQKQSLTSQQITKDEVEPAQSNQLIVIGASAGGPAALATILKSLPQDFPASIIIVQHLDAQFAPFLATWLDNQTSLSVRMVRDREYPQKNTVLIAGNNAHLVFLDSSTIGYVSEPKDCFYKPSIDVFFSSVAKHWKHKMVGVLLTGMGKDGAKGLKALRDRGAITIAQDRGSSIVYGMPKAATEIGAATEVLTLKGIASRLIELTV